MMIVYGYARISTKKQSIERQIRNIKAEFPEAIIVEEKYSGTKMQRPEWEKIYKNAKAGDLIVFDSVSRMSRNAEEGFGVYENLFCRGVDLVFLKERHIDTATYKKSIDGQLKFSVSTGDKKTDDLIDGMSDVINRYLLCLAQEQIRLAFEQAEKEVKDLQQRTKEGIETARLDGKQIGRTTGAKITTKKSVVNKRIIQKHSKDFNGNLSDVELMALTGLSRNTYYKYKKELRDDNT